MCIYLCNETNIMFIFFKVKKTKLQNIISLDFLTFHPLNAVKFIFFFLLKLPEFQIKNGSAWHREMQFFSFTYSFN